MDAIDVRFAVDSACTVAAQFPGSDWYLFGSSANSPETARDIDLLIVHDATVDTSRVRETLADLCMSLPIHLTILTREEEVERGFLARAAPYQRIDVR
jgi:predicted nucleotidyltransferase